MNWSDSLTGAAPLFRKEVLRFWKVAFQTVAAPVLTAVLYLLIFGHVLDTREALLARLRQAQVRIEDLEIGRADLEDVFLAIMQGQGGAASRVGAAA